MSWLTESKAFAKSKYTTSIRDELFKANAKLLVKGISWVRQDFPGRKPCWLLFNIWSHLDIIISLMQYSKNFMGKHVRDIGR